MSGEFPWEKEASRGAEMPEGLGLADMAAYTALRDVYERFRGKRMGRDQAAREKHLILRQWEQAKEAEAFERKLQDYHVRLIRGVERAVTRCRKEPTEANVLYLCDVLDGFEKPEEGVIYGKK